MCTYRLPTELIEILILKLSRFGLIVGKGYIKREVVCRTHYNRKRINICLRCRHTHALYPCNSRLIDCTYTYLLHHCEIPRVMQNANDGLEWGCGTRPTAPLSLPLLYITFYVHYEQQFFAFLSRYYFFTLSYSFFFSLWL